ncbi:MAG: hypothetical protein FWE95_11470 [Planctomycetaceae bacterium]|nr:hypothetical protein [Planctomycetaceae bacterium]
MDNLLKAYHFYLLFLLFVSCGIATQAFVANDVEKPSCSLQARVFDADGKEFQDDRSAEIQVFVFLWQKIANGDGTNVQGIWQPTIHSSDGSSGCAQTQLRDWERWVK